MAIDTMKSVREFAVELPGATRVFEKLGIDYCCRGNRLLEEACMEAGVPAEQVIALLEKEGGCGDLDRPTSHDWSSATLSSLTAYIITKHHGFMREELSRLTELMAKVLAAHGENHPELHRVQSIFRELKDELTDHMLKEEQILFPYINNLEASVARGEPVQVPFFGSVRNPIRIMTQEHDNAGRSLRGLREASSDFQVPVDACASFRALYQALEALEMDLHAHIHLENNILFPRAAELEKGA
jgi:regulator of cell morphogenesis and NO signaling